MSKRIPAPVSPALLTWGRQSMRMSIEEAARKTKLDAELIRSWELGERSPSVSQLRKLGEVYKRPIAVFFLAEPPRGFDAQKEFRRIPGITPGKESSELMLAIRNATYHRDSALELLELLGESKPKIDLVIHPSMNAEEVGAIVREDLRIDWKDQLEWSSSYSALSGWRNAIESKGILIFQTGKVPLQEMRGTCMPDHPLPIVILNSKDSPHGRVFTLLHEYIHILLHNGGHQTSRMDGLRAPEEQSLEVAANAFAASTLLPFREFMASATQYPSASVGDDNALRLLSQKVKVSPEVVLRRLVTLGKAGRETYRQKRKDWGETIWYTGASAGGPIPQPVRILANEGRSYTRLVLDAFDRRLITSSAASDYLGAKPIHFDNIRRELASK